MRRLKGKLTYANVMSTIAVFLLLGGGAAFAATKLGKNTVGTKQIKNNAVSTAKIQNGAINGEKVNLASLGTVPNAKHAETATSATSASSAANANALGGASASAYRDKCPSETSPAAIGLCVTNSSLGFGNFTEALAQCGEHGLQVPSPAQAEAVLPKLPEAAALWTDSFYVDTTSKALVFYAGAKVLIAAETTVAKEIFCVAAPSNN
jgi:hypothetical protein